MTFHSEVCQPLFVSPRMLFAAALLTASFASAAAALPPPLEEPLRPCTAGGVARMVADSATLFLLEADGSGFTDTAGRIPSSDIQVMNGEMTGDPCGLTVLRFGEKPGSITVQDGGKLSFADGLTIEAWIFLEAPLQEKQKLGFAEKAHKKWDKHAFSLTLESGHVLTLGHLGFVGEAIQGAPVAGREKRPLKPVEFYPGRCNTMNGLNAFPAGKWTHVAFTYDRVHRLLRTWVDFGVDREALNAWYEVASEIVDDDTEPVTFFKGATNIRVAQIRFSGAARRIGAVPPVKVHVSELPYRGCRYVTLIQTSDELPLPAEVTVMNIRPPVLNAVNRFVLNDREIHRYPIPEHVWACAESELVVRIFHKGREVFKHNDQLINASAAGPSGWRFLRGAPWTNGPKHPDWWIEENNVISHFGTNVFPIGLYHVTTNDFDFTADLGFTMIGLRKSDNKLSSHAWRQAQEPYYAKAAARGITLFAHDDVDDRPGEGFIYALDEPWGYSFEPFRRRYQALRNSREHPADLPIVATQNNWQRYRETALAADILAVDPYCRGRMPLRFVYDATRAALRETDALKPVMTIVDSYGSERMRPSFEELRTMSYLAVIGGASALSFYAWDDGIEKGIPTNTRDMTQCVEDYRRLMPELKAMTPAFTVPNLAAGPVFVPATPRGFFACAKAGADRRLYIIVASDLYSAGTRKMAFPSAAGKTAKLLYGPAGAGASEQLNFDAAGHAEIALPPLGTAVYVVTDAPGV